MNTVKTKATESIEGKTLTNWQAVGIGAITSIVALFLFFIFWLRFIASFDTNHWNPRPWERSWHIFWNDFVLPQLVSMDEFWPVIALGIGGALAGKFWKETRRAAWIGAVLGSLSVMAIFVFIILTVQ